MLAKNSYGYILVVLRAMRNVNESQQTSFLRKGISNIEESLTDLGFDVSMQIVTSESFEKITLLLEEQDAKEESTISPEIVKLAHIEFATLEKVIYAEACTKKIYSIPDRRFNSEYLLNEPHKLLEEGAFDLLSEIARSDISSSCRCILFGEATASAFHILRATEDVLKNYYYLHRKQKRLTKPMWGPMLEQLKAKKSNKPPLALLESLDLLRKNYRNPTQHPNALYTIDTAQDLFGVCLDVIGKMASEL